MAARTSFRVERIIDAVEGAVAQRSGGPARPDPRAGHRYFVKAVVNYLVLLYKQPCFVSLWAWDGGGEARGFYTSLGRRDRQFLGIPQPAWSVPFRHARLAGERSHRFSAGDASRGLQVVVEHLFHGQVLLDVVSEADLRRVLETCADELRESTLTFGWDEHEVPPDSGPGNPWLAAVPIEVQDQVVGPFRRRLSAFFDELTGLGGAFRSSEAPINLFAVVRHRLAPGNRCVTPPVAESFVRREPTAYDYTASLLLTKSQQDWVDKVASGLVDAGHEPWRLLELPLGKSSRSIADTVFDSGILDFGLPSERQERDWSRDFAPESLDARERQRRDLETRVYGRVCGGFDSKPTIFYSAIHVGGTPWLALFTFSPGSEDAGEDREAWLHSYHTYRDQLPRIALQLRELAQQAYAECLAHFLGRALGTSNPVEQINQHWQTLGRFYPFPTFQLAPPAEGDDKILEFPGGARWALGFGRHSWPLDDIELGLLRREPIWKVLEESLKIARTIQAKTQISVLDGVAHDAYNSLSAIGSATLGSLLGDGVPPKKLGFTLHVPGTGERDKELEEILLQGLRRTYAAEETTRGALALGRILAAQGRVSWKFCATHPFSTGQVLTEALEMVLAIAGDEDSLLNRPVLELQESERAFSIQAGYLELRILRAIAFEILLNHTIHCPADSPDRGTITLHCGWSRDESRKGASLVVASRALSQEWMLHKDDITIPAKKKSAPMLGDSFLFRFAEISRATQGGLRIRTRVMAPPLDQVWRPAADEAPNRDSESPFSCPDAFYVTEFSLGALEVATKEGSLERITPI